jgi:two-component system, NtrC family, response regulator AtoC
MEHCPSAEVDSPAFPVSTLQPVHNTRIHAFVLDDDEEILGHLQSMLRCNLCSVSAFSCVDDAVSDLQNGVRPDIAFIKLNMPGQRYRSALAWFHQLSPTTPSVALSCSYDPQTIVEAMKMGAVDVLVQPFDKDELCSSVRRWVNSSASQECTQVTDLPGGNSFVLCSDAMKLIASQCANIAQFDLPVLILGESGTGKEVLAQYIHQMSFCADKPFLKVNCAAVPTDLLESELFGYEQGAFTGAMKSKPGKFELCDKGTIFLDEIGEIPTALQAKLLQVLQDGTFWRLGGRTAVKVDVRVIAATNIDIKAAIADRRFREDLYYRLNGMSLHLPPLRERKQEIPVLFRHFMEKMAKKYARRPVVVSDSLMAACLTYPWPGNLRELENFVRRFLVLADEQIMMAELSSGYAASVPRSVPTRIGDYEAGLKKLVSNLKEEAEAEVITRALQQHRGKHKQTAAALKISYKALLYKMRQYGIGNTSDGVA